MSLPKYPEYKDSGVSWLGEVPAHWRTASLKWLCQLYSGGTPDKNQPEFWENGTIPWLNSGAVNNSRIYDASAYITEEAFKKSSAKFIPPGSLVMALAGQGKTKGTVAQLMFESTCNQSMAAIVPNLKLDVRCLYWWLVSNYQNIRNMAGGDLRDGLNLELLGSIPCPLPPVEEQTLIAMFLDCETAKIDALIAEQEKLIALLAEKRQATISRVVTRGLDPNVPLKDSGVPWLGKVPAHWDCRKLSTVADAIGDGLHGTPNYSEDSECFFINGNNLSSGRIRITESTRMVCMQDYLLQNILLDHRSVLLSINGTIGNVALYAGEKVMLGKSAAYINCGEGVSREYLAYFLLSDICRNYFLSNLSGTTIYNLSLETIRLAKIPLPNIDDQLNIVAYLDQKLYQLDELVAEATSSIGLLKERRAALISAAVTGKIDLRGLAA